MNIYSSFHLLSSLAPQTSSLCYPPSHARSIRGLPPARVPANNATSLASRSLLNLGILPKADQGWREAHGDHFLVQSRLFRHLPQPLAQQVVGQNLLVGLASHLDISLSRALPVSTRSIQHPFLQTAVVQFPASSDPITLWLPLSFSRRIWLRLHRCLSLAPLFS
jgi:hypothetical protein